MGNTGATSSDVASGGSIVDATGDALDDFAEVTGDHHRSVAVRRPGLLRMRLSRHADPHAGGTGQVSQRHWGCVTDLRYRAQVRFRRGQPDTQEAAWPRVAKGTGRSAAPR